MSEPPAEQDVGVLAPLPRRPTRRLVFAVTGLALAVALAAASVILANRQPPPRPAAILPGPAGQGLCSAAFSPDGTTLAVADNSGNIYLWNLATRRVTATVPASRYCAPVCPIAFSPDGTLLAVGQTEPSGAHGHVYLWDLAARRWAGTLTDPGSGISSLAFGRHGILVAGADDHAYLWDVPARKLAGAIAPPIDVAQGNASISKDGTPYPAPGAVDRSTTAAFSPDGTTLAIDASFGYAPTCTTPPPGPRPPPCPIPIRQAPTTSPHGSRSAPAAPCWPSTTTTPTTMATSTSGT